MGVVEVTLPRGVALGEQWCREAWLGPVTGREEEFLAGDGRFLSPAARVTGLLARCLRRLGPLDAVDLNCVRHLSVGDRESLLLHLRRLTLGDRLSSTLPCPACGARMDLDLSIEELLLPPYQRQEEFHEVTIPEGDASYGVRFRCPNGEDQELAATLAAESLPSAAELVMRRCIARVVDADGQELAEIPECVLRRLPEHMASFDPQAEVLLDLTCPECRAVFEVPFDIGDYLYRELACEERSLYRDVHALSLHYHWPEEAILGLERRKRHIYVNLLAEQLSGGAA